MSKKEISRFPALKAYLEQHKERLISRKGIMINSWIQKSVWWALLGVGIYSFAPIKIIWQAYGKKTFSPHIFTSYNGQPWQVNQSLQAGMGFYDISEAEKVLEKLKNPKIESYLLKFKMAGKCNWAQPGRIKPILNIAKS